MVQERGGARGRGLKVAYTNINGLLSAGLEIQDYLKEEKPDIIGLVETKLTGDVNSFNIGDEDYNVWFRNRTSKQGGGVMLLVKKDLLVESAVYWEGKAKILKIVQKETWEDT